MSKKELRVGFHLSFYPAILKALEDRAKQEDRSMSYIVRKAVEAYLKVGN